VFTQNIEYQEDERYTGYSEYWKFPLETLCDQGGDCEDTAILFVALAHVCADKLGLDYKLAIQLLPQHAGGAVLLDDPEGYDTNPYGYIFAETTATGYDLGDVPGKVEDEFLEEKYYSSVSVTIEIERTRLQESDGGAILVGEKESSITINGSIKASDNTADGAGPNVYFAADSKFIAGNFLNGDGCSIGVVLENQERDFTSGFGDIPSNDPAKTFKSDDPNYYVAADPDTKEAKTFKSGSGGDMSGDNTLLIVGGVIAVLAIVGIAVCAVKIRKP